MSDFNLVPKTFKIDIGTDGGVLEIDQTQPVIRYKINGEPASEADAWRWIAKWHRTRDEALGADPCRCSRCQWWWDWLPE